MRDIGKTRPDRESTQRNDSAHRLCLVASTSSAAAGQCADDGKRIQLNNLDPEIAPNAREQFEPEEHPDFDGMGHRCWTDATLNRLV
jgi:hypothetical protein